MPRSPPASVGPTFKAIQELARNARNTKANTPLDPKRVILVQKRIAALEKRNKRWAAISTLLVTGSVGAAVALAKSQGVPIPESILKAAELARQGLKWSGSGAARVLKDSASMIVGQLYMHTLLLPLAMAQQMYSRKSAGQHTNQRTLTQRAIVENNNNNYYNYYTKNHGKSPRA